MKGKILDFSKASYSCSIGGKSMALLSVTIKSQLNAPPSVDLVAVPKDYQSRKIVDSSDAQLFWSALSTMDKDTGKPSGNLSISKLGPDSDFDFNANEWVISEIGVDASATADGPAAIKVSLMHPIVQLDKYPANAGPVTHSPDPSAVSGSDYLTVVRSALDVYSKHIVPSAKKGPAYEMLRTGLSDMNKYVKPEGCDISKLANLFPWFTDQKHVLNGFKKYILSAVSHGTESSSLFALVIRGIATDLSLCLYPDPEDLASKRMILKPYIPYTPETVEVEMDTLMGINSVFGNWLVPSGVYAVTRKLNRAWFNNAAGECGGDFAFASVIAKDNGSQTVSAKAPAWYDAILGYVASAWWNNATQVADNDLDLANTNHQKSIRKLLTQDFLDVFRQTRSVVLRRMFSSKGDDGNLIVPGKTCSVTGGGGKGLLFLISGVSHTFNMLNNSAFTTISGNYVRGGNFSVKAEGAEDVEVISDGFSADKNYIWG